jgi:NAD(P)H-nitrite reductase large subunit
LSSWAPAAVAAQTLREDGFGGRVLMLDRDNRVPYDRTILSKYALSGEKGGEKSPLQSQSFYRDQRIERITAEVSAVDAEARRITCTDGRVFAYDAALLATGGVPKRVDIPGAGLGNVFVLRSSADSEAILAQAERSTRAVILGASFIGMEVAASLRERGLDVTVIGREALPFEKQLGREVGAALVGLHAKRGVAFRAESRAAALEGGPDVRAVRLENGERIPADLVVIGFGVAPATAMPKPCRARRMAAWWSMPGCASRTGFMPRVTSRAFHCAVMARRAASSTGGSRNSTGAWRRSTCSAAA